MARAGPSPSSRIANASPQTGSPASERVSAAHGVRSRGAYATRSRQIRACTAAGWKPTSGIFYTVEDQDNSNGGYLNPGWGGQAYDAEALYATWSTHANGQTYLDIALITGHDPSTITNGSSSFGRGDFAIDFGRDGSWDFGILTANRSTTLHQGDVVATTNADWAKGLWTAPGVYDPPHSQYITSVKTGTDVGDAALAISNVFTNMGSLGAKRH